LTTAGCVQCGAALGMPPALCPACGALQPFRPELSLFAVLGLPETFAMDAALLRERVFALQKRLHPDRFAAADAATRLRSLEWSTRLNEAFAVLRDPLRRADYLLQRQGVTAMGEGARVADTRLLMAQMEYRERLEDLAKRADPAGLETLRGEIEQAASAVVERLHALLASLPSREPEQAAAAVRELQFLHKLRQELESTEETLQNR